MEVSKVFENLIIPLIIAVTTAFVTVRLSVKRFHAEHWWEQKVGAYSKIIESLHHMKKYCDKQLDAAYMHRNIPEAEEKFLRLKLEEAEAEIEKATDMGCFIICSQAATLLENLQEELSKTDKAQSFIEFLEIKLTAINSCLVAIRKIAANDLQIKWMS